MGRALLILETPQVREKAMDWIRRAPVGTRVEFKASKRSLPQNDLLWALLTDVQAQMKARGVDYSIDQWKVIMLHAWGREVEFLPSLSGDTFIPYGQSSSDLSKEEMTDFIEFIISEAAKRDITLRIPNNESSGAPSPQTPDDGDTPPPVSPEPVAQTPSPEATGSDIGKWNYEGQDLAHLREFAEKAIREIRRSGEIAGSQLIDAMHPQYRVLLKTADAVTALESIKRGLELVVEKQRNIDRIEAWIETEFLSCEPSDLMREASE